MKRKFYFVYGRKSRNQVSKMYRYRKVCRRLRDRMNNGNKQYGLGWMMIWPEMDIRRHKPKDIKFRMRHMEG